MKGCRETRLIDANAAKEELELDYAYAAAKLIDNVPTIDPETLPIVRELREKLARYEKAEKEGRMMIIPKNDGPIWHIEKKKSSKLR